MSYRDRLQQRLDETGRPLRVGLVGAGQMGTGPRRPAPPDAGHRALRRLRRRPRPSAWTPSASPASRQRIRPTWTPRAEAIESGGSVALGGIDELGGLPLDIVVEATGVPDVGARVAVEALASGKDIATLNVESDVTIGGLPGPARR